MLHRIFLAINLPDSTKKKLLQYQHNLKELFAPYRAEPLRWTSADNFHITLVFLGNTSDKELHEIQKIARKVATSHKTFSFSLSQIAYGPTQKQPKMIWAKGTIPKELLAFQQDVAKAFGYQEEHPFSLHVTLARLNAWEFKKIEPEERPAISEKIFLTIPVSSLRVMESTLRRGGAEYKVLGTYNLKHET